MLAKPLITALLSIPLSVIATASAEMPSDLDEQALRQRYAALVESLDHRRIAKEYPKAVEKLDSPDPQVLIAGIKTLAATGEIEVIPWIVPFVDSKNGHVRIRAGLGLLSIVATHELKRRDPSRTERVVIMPPSPGDHDLRPMAWVILKMLRGVDDGNTHSYAAGMIGYLGLEQFEGELRKLLRSRHPAVTRAAHHALEMLGADQPNSLSTAELDVADQSQRTFDVTQQADGKRFTKAYALIQEGQYEQALNLLKLNIAETPNAGNIDYSYGWACLCAAHLGRLDETLDYYRVMRTHFYGWLHVGANGANRKWDDQLAMAQRAVAHCDDPEKDSVLKKMTELDEWARRKMLADLERLARRAAGGDQVAILQLRQCPHGLVDLIAEGRLVVTGSPEKLSAAPAP